MRNEVSYIAAWVEARGLRGRPRTAPQSFPTIFFYGRSIAKAGDVQLSVWAGFAESPSAFSTLKTA